MPSLYANLRVATRVYDVEGGAIFSKNSTFVFFDGAAWTPRLRSPSPIMAPGPHVIEDISAYIAMYEINISANFRVCVAGDGAVFRCMSNLNNIGRTQARSSSRKRRESSLARDGPLASVL